MTFQESLASVKLEMRLLNFLAENTKPDLTMWKFDLTSDCNFYGIKTYLEVSDVNNKYIVNSIYSDNDKFSIYGLTMKLKGD